MSEVLGSSADRRRILVVEDEPLLAMDLEAVLIDAGFAVIGPASGLEEALRRLHHETVVDGAVLDIALHGSFSFPIADALADRGIPFLFVSGHAREILPERHQCRRVVQKPYQPERLIADLLALVTARTLDTRPCDTTLEA